MAHRIRRVHSNQAGPRRSLWGWWSSGSVIDDCQGELAVILDHRRSVPST